MSPTRDVQILTVPGWSGSNETHWQSLWEAADPSILRVVQDDWYCPDRGPWVDRLCQVVEAQERPVFLVAHSLGAGTTVHAAAEGRLGKVVGAFLVAMPDMERPEFAKDFRGFSPVPRTPLPFPAMVVGSRNDPFIGIDALADWARILGAEFVDAGHRHHIGDAARLGYWEQGRELFEEFFERATS